VPQPQGEAKGAAAAVKSRPPHQRIPRIPCEVNAASSGTHKPRERTHQACDRVIRLSTGRGNAEAGPPGNPTPRNPDGERVLRGDGFSRATRGHAGGSGRLY